MVAVRANRERIYPLYLFAILRSAAVQYQISQLHVGTLIPHFKKGDFDKLLLPLVPRRVQEFIGDMYFAFSQKIDLNRRMNETLEGMSRALFKRWFIDFDPVHAKIAGRAPSGVDAAVAGLFPSELASGQPRGWSSLPLDHVADFLNGLALQTFPAVPGEPSIPVIKIAQIRAGSADDADGANLTVPPSHRIDDGDLIFSWSGSLLVRLWAGGPGALNQHLFKVTSSAYPRWFIHGWLNHHLPGFQAIAAAKATTMGHIQRHHLTAAAVIVPNREILERSGDLMAPLETLVLKNNIENRALRAARDSLLPKLLSGALCIRDAERDVDKVA